MNIGELNEGWLLGHKEDVFLEEEEVALDSFQIGFDAGVTITAESWKSEKELHSMS